MVDGKLYLLVANFSSFDEGLTLTLGIFSDKNLSDSAYEKYDKFFKHMKESLTESDIFNDVNYKKYEDVFSRLLHLGVISV